MNLEGLLIASGILCGGIIVIALHRHIGRAVRFGTLNRPDLKGWGYWEKLIPSERVASSLNEMLFLLVGILMVVLGLYGLAAIITGNA